MTRTLRILAALAVLLLSGTVLQAQDTAKQESRRDALRKEIAQLEQQLKENASKSNNAMTELKLVRKQVATRRELVAESEREIRALSDTIAVRQQAAKRLRERLEAMEAHYRRLRVKRLLIRHYKHRVAAFFKRRFYFFVQQRRFAR